MTTIGRPRGSKLRPERIKMGIVIQPHVKKWLKATGKNQSRLIEEAVIQYYRIDHDTGESETIAVVEVIQ